MNEVLMGEPQLDPANREIAFVESTAARAAADFEAWLGNSATKSRSIDTTAVEGSLVDVVRRLWPLTAPETLRYLFLETAAPGWCAYFDNGVAGSDTANIAAQLPRRLRCRGIRVVAVDDDPAAGREGGTMFELFDQTGNVRSVAAVNDGGKWVFEQFGEPLPAERTDAYRARVIRQRLDFNHVSEIAASFGLRPFDRAFFEPAGKARGVLIERVGVATNREVHWRSS